MTNREEAIDEVVALAQNIERLESKLGTIDALTGRNSNTAASNVTLNAGGIGVWLAVSACAVSVAVTIVAVIFGALAISELGRQINDQGRQVGRAQDHLTAIYMMAPHLKPKDSNVQHDHHHYAAAEEAAEVGKADPAANRPDVQP